MVTRIPLPLARLHLDAATAARWTTVLLVLLLGASLAQFTWLTLPKRPLPAAPQAGPTKMAATAAVPSLDSVAAMRLFGTPQATAAPAGTKINAPDTSLNLTLRGLFAAARKESAFAIIAEGSGSERHYRVGAKLSGGAVVHDILADRVVLDRNGSFEILRLPKERLELGAPPGGAASPGTSQPLPQGQLRELRETIKNNPQELMNLAEMQPVMQDGQLRGYRIRPRRHLGLFQSAGLTANDIVTAVNGIAVTDPGQFANLTEQLSSAPSLRLSVERPNGVSEDIVINLN